MHSLVYIFLIPLIVFARPVPLPNCGNTCYLNASIQALYAMQPLRKLLTTPLPIEGQTFEPHQLFKQIPRAPNPPYTNQELKDAQQFLTLYARQGADIGQQIFALNNQRNVLLATSSSTDQIDEEIKRLQAEREKINVHKEDMQKIINATTNYYKSHLPAGLALLFEKLVAAQAAMVLGELPQPIVQTALKQFILYADNFISLLSLTSAHAQQDATEFLLPLIEELIDQASAHANAHQHSPLGTASKELSSKLQQLFQFQSKQIKMCPDKTNEIISIPPSINLQLYIQLLNPLHTFNSLAESLANYFAPYTPSGFDCILQNIITKPSQLLMLSLRRFIDTGKLTNSLDIPLADLNIGTFMQPSQAVFYNLRSVIIHMGSIGGGHYTAYVQDDDHWYYCNDSSITPINPPATMGEGYVYFYENDEIIEEEEPGILHDLNKLRDTLQKLDGLLKRT